MIQVTVWNEYRHERTNPAASEIYPNGIHTALASKLQDEYGLAVQTATLDEPEHGLTVDVLNHTDVLIWWGHIAHDEVDDAIVNRVHTRVLEWNGIDRPSFRSLFENIQKTDGNLLCVEMERGR